MWIKYLIEWCNYFNLYFMVLLTMLSCINSTYYWNILIYALSWNNKFILHACSICWWPHLKMCHNLIRNHMIFICSFLLFYFFTSNIMNSIISCFTPGRIVIVTVQDSVSLEGKGNPGFSKYVTFWLLDSSHCALTRIIIEFFE